MQHRTHALLTFALLFALFAAAVYGADTSAAAKIALLVDAPAEQLVQPLGDALRSADPLVRATASRVALVRDVRTLAPVLRELVPHETSPLALREQLRALVILGDDTDIDVALAAAKAQPPVFDAVVADAIARRLGPAAIDLYPAKLRKLRDLTSAGNFFQRALWGHVNRIPATTSLLLADGDERGWRLLMEALRVSELAPAGDVLLNALAAKSEEIRTDTAWFLAGGYAADPTRMSGALRTFLAAPDAEVRSDREAFARELLRRMTGAAPRPDERWVKWLATEEADRYVAEEGQLPFFFTPEELKVRQNRCAQLLGGCSFKPANKVIPAAPVMLSAFRMPGTLPPGLGDALMAATGCRGSWLGVAGATVDDAGRVQSVDLNGVETSCKKTLPAILRLSLADNNAIGSMRKSTTLLLAKAARVSPCLDEALGGTEIFAVGGHGIAAPTVKRRVNPLFPEDARRAMGPQHEVHVVLDAVISESGCIRNVRLVEQSPYPTLNGQAVLAFTQWLFDPARLNGVPVDAQMNLTINFKVR